MAGRITARADKFAQKYHTPEPEVATPAEIEAKFARDFMSPVGLREQWQKIRDERDAVKTGSSYAR